MGFFGKLFRSQPQPTSEPHFDVEVKRQQLTDLSRALTALVRRMNEDDFPTDNPGWQGRISDLAEARRAADELHGRDFTRQDLFDFGTTVRPLYRGKAPEIFAGLDTENELVVRALDALLD